MYPPTGSVLSLLPCSPTWTSHQLTTTDTLSPRTMEQLCQCISTLRSFGILIHSLAPLFLLPRKSCLALRTLPRRYSPFPSIRIAHYSCPKEIIPMYVRLLLCSFLVLILSLRLPTLLPVALLIPLPHHSPFLGPILSPMI